MNRETPRKTINQQVLDQYRDRFASQTQYGAEILKLFRNSNVDIYRFEPDPPGRWWLNLVMPPQIAEMFDTQLEVACLYTEYRHVEPRLLSVLQRRLRDDARVDPEFAVVASLDSELGRLVARKRGEFALLSIDATQLSIPSSADLRTRMSEVLTGLDHYDVTFPVTEISGFFGRRREVDALKFSLDRGQPVGIFGLRKAGKTSLLNFVQRQRAEAGRPVVRLDMSEVASASEFRLQFLQRTQNLLRQGDHSIPNLKLLTREGTYRAANPPIDLHWVDDLSKLLDKLDDRLEIIIDEIDQAYPDRSSLGFEAARELFTALTQLRGLIQRRDSVGSSSLVLLCAGVDAAIFERPLLGGRDNLIYKLVRLQFLTPMERDEMAEMVRSLGKRMGLRVRDHLVIDYLFDQYGGHPLLTRKACSIATRNRPRDEIPWDIPLDAVQEAAAKRGRDTPAEQAADVLASFEEWFPGEAYLLKSLWSGPDDDRKTMKQLLEEDPKEALHIPAYGLANDDWSPRINAMVPFLCCQLYCKHCAHGQRMQDLTFSLTRY